VRRERSRGGGKRPRRPPRTPSPGGASRFGQLLVAPGAAHGTGARAGAGDQLLRKSHGTLSLLGRSMRRGASQTEAPCRRRSATAVATPDGRWPLPGGHTGQPSTRVTRPDAASPPAVRSEAVAPSADHNGRGCDWGRGCVVAGTVRSAPALQRSDLPASPGFWPRSAEATVPVAGVRPLDEAVEEKAARKRAA
jgi:hypothetical protein